MIRASRHVQFMVTSCLAVFTTTSARADWTRFRGPNGSGISTSDAPTEFGADNNLKWKLELPGRGVSSPIVVGDRVFVTCYSGYGFEGGNVEDLKRHLVCVDRVSGETLWTKTVNAKMPEDEWRPPGVTTHGYASNTPVSDGEHVFAFFGKSGVYAFDLDGNEIWNQSVGQEPSFKGFGSAASPIVTDEHVIVNAADESLSIVWLDKKTGTEAHRATADGLGECWTTPILIENGGRSEIAISVIGEIWGLNNETGKLSWYANGVNSRNAQVSLVEEGGVVYAVGEEAYAIRIDGKGDVSESNTVWEGRLRPRYATPVLLKGRLYSVSSGAVIECVDAKTGDRVFQGRLPGGSGGGADRGGRGDFGGGGFGGRGGGGFGGGGRGGFGGRGGGGGDDYASPVAADDKIYITTNGGMIHVIEAKDELSVLASNDMSFDSSGFGGTPAISDGCLFLRSNTHLYCVGSE
ncbi:MAG: PQQ-binding-like beta-propeller repeat protein [Planctomycetota bacterium]